VIILSQTIRDFAYDSASIRQNTNTKMFLHNSDREVEYAATFLGDGRALVRLAPGTAIVYNASWGAATIKVRPPLSKVWEFSAQATRGWATTEPSVTIRLSESAQELLDVVRKHYRTTGQGTNLAHAAQRVRITSKRRIQILVDKLERAGVARTY